MAWRLAFTQALESSYWRNEQLVKKFGDGAMLAEGSSGGTMPVVVAGCAGIGAGARGGVGARGGAGVGVGVGLGEAGPGGVEGP